jgi:DNA-binding CsgD family transcriptional regulator
MKKITKTLSIIDFILFAMLFTVIAINTSDFIEDILEGDGWLHIILEIITVSLSIGGIVLLTRMIIHRIRTDEYIQKVENNLSLTRHKLQQIGREYSLHIQEQFEFWKFTHSEKEVALLILKGLSFSEIAKMRNTKEKTVRQQASSVYRKSGVAGRHELAAWFLEDLLV